MHPFSARPLCILLSIIVLCGLLTRSFADQSRPVESGVIAKGGKFPVRSLKITRTGGAYARPTTAYITFPFITEGADWMESKKQEEALLETYKKIVASFDPMPNRVFVQQSQSGQTYRDNKPISTYTGTIRVCVRNLALLKPIGKAIAKVTSQGLSVEYFHEVGVKMHEYEAQSQQAAIRAARKQADFLAKAAGTRIVGVLAIREGQIQEAPPTLDEAYTPEQWKTPAQVLVAFSDVCVDFELASPQNEPTPKPKSPTPMSQKLGRVTNKSRR